MKPAFLVTLGMLLVRLCTPATLTGAEPGERSTAGTNTATSGPALSAADLERVLAQLHVYEWNRSRADLQQLEEEIIRATRADPGLRTQLEKRLIAVLRSPSPRAAQDFACRQLSLIGTSDSVPGLAALLPDAELSHMARFALERIPGLEARGALRQGLERTDGLPRLGIIDSLGALRDTEAVPLLAMLVSHADTLAATATATAAARALGRIGTAGAAQALERARALSSTDVQPVVDEARLTAAVALEHSGNRAEAMRVLRALMHQTAAGFRTTAFRLLVQAGSADAMPLVIQALTGPDFALQKAAVRLISDNPSMIAVTPLLEQFPSLAPSDQIAILVAVRDRHEISGRPAVLIGCDSAHQGVRQAALAALGAVGSADDVERLARIAAGSGAERDAARLALANLPGREATRAIERMLSAAPPAIRAALIRALGSRGHAEAAPALTNELRSEDRDIRMAALESLAAVGTEHQAPAVIALVHEDTASELTGVAEKTLAAIVTRTGPACRPALIEGIQNWPAFPFNASQTASLSARARTFTLFLLEQLGRVGGSEALRLVRMTIDSGDQELSDGAFRVLTDWPDMEAAPALLEVVRASSSSLRRELALRGYVRLCREGNMLPRERLHCIQQAAELADQSSDRVLVASALAEVPEVEALPILTRFLEDAAVVDAASLAALKIGLALQSKHKDKVVSTTREVLARSQNPEIRKQAQTLLDRLESAKPGAK